MAFANQCMARITLFAQDIGSHISMQDIGLFPKTGNTLGIGQEYADVVQHGSFFDEETIRLKLGMDFDDTKSQGRHIATMFY